MTIVVNNPQTWVQGASYVGFENLCLDNPLVASREDAGYPVSNAAGWTVVDKYRVTHTDTVYLTLSLPAARQVNSFGIYKHNLSDLGLNVALEYATNAAGPWTELIPASSVVDNATIYRVSATGALAKYWRVVISGHAGASLTAIIGSLFIGESLRLFGGPEGGFIAPDQAINDVYVNSKSDGGDFLGRSVIAKAGKGGHKMSAVDSDWVRENWEPFRKAANKHPFFYSWDAVNYPQEVGFCEVERMSQPRYNAPRQQTLDLKFVVK